MERDAALLKLAQPGETSERAAAADALHELATDAPDHWPELISLLPRLLEDAQEDVRRTAVAMGALMLDANDVEAFLSKRLEDAAVGVRLEAVGQLSDLAKPSTRSALAKALEDPAFLVRFEGARGMATLHHSAGREVLEEGLGRDDLRFRALGALAELADPASLPALRKVFERWFLPGFERTQAAGALACLGDAAGAKHLLDRARGSWSPDRALAVELCGGMKLAGAYEVLTKILRTPKDPCRGAAARGLGRLGDSRALAQLTELFLDKEAPDDFRLDAAEGLCHLRPPGAREQLEAALPTLAQAASREELTTLVAEYF